jgi:hypothetical protein
LDDRGGDTTLPPLLSRAWWLFLNALNGAVSSVSDSLDLAAATIPLKLQAATQAQLAGIGPTLPPGSLVEVTDYAHILRWTGSAWAWGPGEQGSGMLVPFAAAPTGGGWHACDGTAVTYLKADGTTGTVTVPNTAASAAYIKAGGSYAAAITAAAVPVVSQPTFAGSALGTHAHVVPIAKSGNSLYTADAPFGTGGYFAVTGRLDGVAVSGSSTGALTDAQSAGTPAGTVSQPTATLPGDPVAHFQVLLWFRQ